MPQAIAMTVSMFAVLLVVALTGISQASPELQKFHLGFGKRDLDSDEVKKFFKYKIVREKDPCTITILARET